MIMKKILSYLIALLAMSMIASAAPSAPMPFVVIVDTYIPSDGVGVEVIVRDVTHPYTIVLYTNEAREAAGDWGNAQVKGEIGDVFEITVGSKTITATMQDYGLGVVHVSLIETTKDCPLDTTPYSLETCPVKEVIKEVIKEVPVTVEKIVEKTNIVYQCADGAIQSDTCPEVSVANYSYLYAFLSAIFALLVAKYVPYGGKMRITRYLSKGQQKMKIEKYEKYEKADGSYGYRWKVVSDVFA